MSDRAAILDCFRYFLNCPRPRLSKAREAKVVEGDLARSFIRDEATRDIFI